MLNKTMLNLGSNRSVIRELFEYGKKQIELCGAENVYDYSLGNPSVPAPENVNINIKKLVDSKTSISLHGYTSAVGDNAVRTAIADDLNRRFGTDYTMSNLYMTCGAAASLVATIRALVTEAADEIIAIAPFFPEYRPFVEANGGKFSFVSADTENFQVNFDELESKISARTQGIIVNSPNNPSGTVYNEDTIKRIADILNRKSKEYNKPIYIICDEPYRELVYDDVIVPFVPNFYDNTIVCYSYSKSLSLPGERIGYALIPSKCTDATDLYNAIAGAARICGYVCAPSLMQYVVGACASEKPDISAYKRNRDLLYNSLTEMGYECAYPAGAFYLFIKAPNGNAGEFSEIAKKYNLLLVPGDSFECPTYLRAAYCVDYEMIKRSLPAFEKAILEIKKCSDY
ncbi:MAG TPA: pyridoxal phosphate-dependent aminotransferase [Clostridiales bacterium]|mgnify:CR=1 FL=1|nr:pyridoxal phosphate-dependent aminotransferase [Clostridiales bacterium]